MPSFFKRDVRVNVNSALIVYIANLQIFTPRGPSEKAAEEIDLTDFYILFYSFFAVPGLHSALGGVPSYLFPSYAAYATVSVFNIAAPVCRPDKRSQKNSLLIVPVSIEHVRAIRNGRLPETPNSTRSWWGAPRGAHLNPPFVRLIEIPLTEIDNSKTMV